MKKNLLFFFTFSLFISFTACKNDDPTPPAVEKAANNIDLIEWINIPAGSFMMGSPEGEEGRMGREGPQHKVSLSAFKMSKYPISFDQYDAFCEATGREKPKDNKWGRGNRPVINISWDDAVAFANWVGEGVRIPTEAEWEYACRAGSTTSFYFGDDKNLLNDYAWNEDNSDGETHPVGEKKPNAWGLYDMHGNVWEWCSDWYDMGLNLELFDKSDKKRYYEKSPENNPKGPEAGELRMRRGGSLFRDYKECRSAVRSSSTPDNSGSDLGIRLVLQK